MITEKEKQVSDESILSDLEYRGVDSFLGELSSGLKVPETLVTRVKDLIEREYGITLKVGSKTKEKHSGHFCLIPYKNSSYITLISVNSF